MRQLLLGFVFFVFALAKAQQQENTLLVIDKHPIYSDEFSSLYLKNLNQIAHEDQKGVEEYLQLFIDYRLKLAEAYRLELDTLPHIVTDYKAHEKQLSDKYMHQTPVTENLLKEAYKRLQKEINASHILVQVSPDAPPKDTLVAYQKAIEAYKKIRNGNDFSEVANTYSEDPSVRKNNGNLGWFGVFDMVYPFETAAYQTLAGEVSKPIRTDFGYHIVKVNNKRNNEGKVQIAHILIKNDNNKEAKKRIEALYKKLQNGARFEDLAKQYSNDTQTAKNGGKVEAFKRGMLKNKTIENKAFAIEEENQYTKPFKTDYGWHILKLLKRFPVQRYEKEKKELRRRIKSDSRAQIISKKLAKSLAENYSVTEDTLAIAYFEKRNATQNITDSKNISEKTIFRIGEFQKTYQDFKNYISRKQDLSTASKNTIKTYYNHYKTEFLKEYHRQQLSTINPEYKLALDEYKNGLLLFELMQQKVWQHGQDSLALRTYYEKHKEDYQTPVRYETLIATADTKRTLKKVRKLLKKKTPISTIHKKHPNVLIDTKTVDKDTHILPQDMAYKKGISEIYTHNGLFLVVRIDTILEPHSQPFSAVKGNVQQDFQNEQEEKWLAELRKRYSVKINHKTLQKIKQELE